MKRIRVCGKDELAPGQIRVVPLGRDRDGYMREALVLRDHAGELRAYRNLCKHLPIPLDGGSRQFLDPEGVHIQCGTHGATYRLNDGFCIAGPCEGEHLDALPLEQTDDAIYLLDEP